MPVIDGLRSGFLGSDERTNQDPFRSELTSLPGGHHISAQRHRGRLPTMGGWTFAAYQTNDREWPQLDHPILRWNETVFRTAQKLEGIAALVSARPRSGVVSNPSHLQLQTPIRRRPGSALSAAGASGENPALHSDHKSRVMDVPSAATRDRTPPRWNSGPLGKPAPPRRDRVDP